MMYDSVKLEKGMHHLASCTPSSLALAIIDLTEHKKGGMLGKTCRRKSLSALRHFS